MSRADEDSDRRYWEHLGRGAGFFSTMRIYPELKLGLVAMGNLTVLEVPSAGSRKD